MNFLRIDAQDRQNDLFLDTDKVVVFSHGLDMADIACKAGLFPSKTQARKNGWDGQIPSGWSEKGSKKNRVYIFNPELDQHVWDHPAWRLFDETGVLDWSHR